MSRDYGKTCQAGADDRVVEIKNGQVVCLSLTSNGTYDRDDETLPYAWGREGESFIALFTSSRSTEASNGFIR